MKGYQGMISIKQIKDFLILAETLHFAKAAVKLGISQATLSSEIQKMEKKLGVKLFDRSDRWEIKLTAAGETYREWIKNIPDNIFKAQQEAQKSAHGETGSLTIAVSNIAYDYINLGEVCKKMLQRYPEVKLKIIDMPCSRNRFDLLCHGNADIAIFAGSNNVTLPEGFIAQKLIALDIALAIPRNNRLAEIENLRVEDLKNVHFVLPPVDEAPNWRRAWDELFMQHCHSLPIVTQEVIGYQGTLQFVAAGLGVGFIFMRNNTILPANVLLRELPITLNRSLLAGMKEGNNSPLVRNFLQLLIASETVL